MPSLWIITLHMVFLTMTLRRSRSAWRSSCSRCFETNAHHDCNMVHNTTCLLPPAHFSNALSRTRSLFLLAFCFESLSPHACTMVRNRTSWLPSAHFNNALSRTRSLFLPAVLCAAKPSQAEYKDCSI